MEGVGDFDYMLKVLLIGDSGVGKSSMLARFVDDTFSQSVLQTVGKSAVDTCTS